MQNQVLLKKLNELPPHKISEVEDFVDFLRQQTKNEPQDRRHRAITEYADEHAGTDTDFDASLEQATVEFLAKDDEK